MLNSNFLFRLNTILIIILLSISCTSHIQKKNTENCERIYHIPGPEDFSLDRETGILYISSHDRRKVTTGHIYTLDLNQPNPTPQKLEINYPSNFNPHGLHFVKIKNDKFLYVISHRNIDQHSIEVFLIEKDKLVFLKSFLDITLESPNDLYVTEDGRIFVSNDHTSGGNSKKFILDLFKIKNAKISYFNGMAWSQFSPEVSLGNGILVKKIGDKELIYWASTLDESVFVYELINFEGKTDIKFLRSINIDSGSDNLEIDTNNSILVGAHKSMVRFLRHASDSKNTSPSQIFRINENESIDEIFASNGEEISASSTGLIYNKKLIIGQVFEPYLLSCSISN
jgi:sugar lactone lactonase YvrE